MAVEGQDQRELQSMGLGIFTTFKSLIETTWADDKSTSTPSRRSIESEEERFRLWAQSLGLNQMGHASLDYRVRDSSVIRASLTGLLSDLKNHLENLASIVLGERPPLEQSHATGAGKDENSDDEASLSSIGSDSFHEADFRLASVVERLDSLYSLAAKIRNPRNRPQRPTMDLYKNIPQSQRLEFKETQEDIQTTLVAFVQQRYLRESVTQEQLRVLGMDEQGLLDCYASSAHWLIKRIGIANARRKQQFVYWERHAELLARDVTLKAPDVPKGTVVEGAPAATTVIPAHSEATSATKLLDARMVGRDDLKSVISNHSRVSTVMSPQGDKLAWPPVPSCFTGSKFFSCPYCKVLCPQSYLSQERWRTHQVNDLQPYQCTYEDCSDPHRLYGRRQEWIDHENQHRRVWHCDIHQEEFETLPAWQLHADEKHAGEDFASPTLRAAFVGSSSLPHRDCPLCPSAFIDLDTMRKHMEYHLERLALYALPDADQDTAKNALPEESADSNQIAEHQGRRNSIEGDFSQEDLTLFAVFLQNQTDETGQIDPTAESLQNNRERTLNLAAFKHDDDSIMRLDDWLSNNTLTEAGKVFGQGDGKISHPCPECPKVFSRLSELKKHLKRHEKPYGCTFYGCARKFGSKNDWKRHEANQHVNLASWHCSEEGCSEVYNRLEGFRIHLQKVHALQDSKEIEEKIEACHVGHPTGQRFWCGFCVKLIQVMEPAESVNLSQMRFNHIGDHFMGRAGFEKKSIEGWRYKSETS